MKMKKVLAVLMAVLMIAVCFAGCGGDKETTDMEYVKEKGKLVVGITDFAPMDYQDKDGNWIGFDADMARGFAEYLGVDVPNDTMGCLQDTHWSGGSFGYFPSYALGSAYGAQMLHAMKNDLGDIETKIAAGDLSDVKAWLGEHIHKHACLYTPGELLEKTCGKFDAQYYIDYLTEKFTKLYNL